MYQLESSRSTVLSASVLDLWLKDRYFEKVHWKHFVMS